MIKDVEIVTCHLRDGNGPNESGAFQFGGEPLQAIKNRAYNYAKPTCVG